MKIKRHALALGIVAGLAGVSGTALGNHSSVGANAQIGWWAAKKLEDAADLDEDQAEVAQVFMVGLGSAVGIAGGALIGAKIGALGGPIGAGVGAGVGAL